MSTLETNSIGKYSGNNVSIDDALNLKSYTTAQRDALTSVAGDLIYNSDDSKVQVHNGSAWEDVGAGNTFAIDYLLVGGGGATNGQGGGGAGGFLNSFGSEASGGGNSSLDELGIVKGTSYTVTVGAGGSAGANNGSNSVLSRLTAYGGGYGGDFSEVGQDGGSGGGGGTSNTGTFAAGSTLTNLNLGFNGGVGVSNSLTVNRAAGGGGGASAVGTAGSGGTGGNGGAGVASLISGSSVTYAGGGGGWGGTTGGSGGTGGGGTGETNPNDDNTSGTANTGGGAGGGAPKTNGGSGIVIIRYATSAATISVGAGLTSSSATVGDDTVVTFTAGTGTISFS